MERGPSIILELAEYVISVRKELRSFRERLRADYNRLRAQNSTVAMGALISVVQVETVIWVVDGLNSYLEKFITETDEEIAKERQKGLQAVDFNKDKTLH